MNRFKKQTIKDVNIASKRVLLRADYNVPLTENGEITDDFRIRSSVPTIKYLHEKGCKVVVISHLGRPKGKEEKYSLAVVAKRLEKLLQTEVVFLDDCIGETTQTEIQEQPDDAVILLENLRFYEQEKANDHEFAMQLAETADAEYFVQDGFGVVHRAHASTEAITHELPSVSGLLLEKEYEAITGAMEQPKHPLVAVLGGAKVSDKLPLLKALVPVADKILVGGAMANTFLAARGYSLGKSKYETDQNAELDEIMHKVAEKVGEDKESEFLRLPTDVVVATSIDETAEPTEVSVDEIGDDDMALDIGSNTLEDFAEQIKTAQTVIWNGTMGYAELPQFSEGSARIAQAISQNGNAVSVVGGGDTADFVLNWDTEAGGSFSHVSTGGGASLELMSGQKLPGIEALLDA